MIINQRDLEGQFISVVSIKSVDARGFYISSGGVHYLYDDGLIRASASTPGAKAFWPTRSEAEDFYMQWLKELTPELTQLFNKERLAVIKEHAQQAVEMTKIIGSMDDSQRAELEVERVKAQDIVNIIDGFDGKA